MRVRAGTRTIGDGEACFIAAESGINHNGDGEKKFTLDRELRGPDLRMSCDVRELVRAVRELGAMLGSDELGPTTSEADSRASFRLSCIAGRELAAGSMVEPDSIVFRRPGTGLPPKALEWIVARALARTIKSSAVLESKEFA